MNQFCKFCNITGYDQFRQQPNFNMEKTHFSTSYPFSSNDSHENSKLLQDEQSDILNISTSNLTYTNRFPDAELLSQSWENVFDEKYLRHNMDWTITLAVAYLLILVIGVIGNSMVILVVLLRPQMRSVTNMFIMNLAVADLFVSFFCVLPTLLANVFQPWILGSFMCKGVAYVQGVSVCASAYSLAAISMDRCQAIKPFKRPRGLSKAQALTVICFIWIIGLLMTIPWAVIFDVIINEDDGFTYCVETWENEFHGKLYFLVANLIFCYGVPLILISVSNGLIWCQVTHRQVPQNSASAAPIKKMHREARHGVIKMLGIVTLTFLISWMPLYIIVTRIKFSENIGDWESNILDKLFPFAQWLGSWNSSVNPILYAFLNKKFRDMFRSILPRWVPLVHRESEIRRLRFNGYHVTISNGHFNGTFVRPDRTTIFSVRNSLNRGCRHVRQISENGVHHNHITLLVSNYDDSRGAMTTTNLLNTEHTDATDITGCECSSARSSISGVVAANTGLSPSNTSSIVNL